MKSVSLRLVIKTLFHVQTPPSSRKEKGSGVTSPNIQSRSVERPIISQSSVYWKEAEVRTSTSHRWTCNPSLTSVDAKHHGARWVSGRITHGSILTVMWKWAMKAALFQAKTSPALLPGHSIAGIKSGLPLTFIVLTMNTLLVIHSSYTIRKAVENSQLPSAFCK